MLFILFKLNVLREIKEVSVHPRAHIAGTLGVLKNLDMLALLAPDHRREDLNARAFGKLQYAIHDLVDGLLPDLLAAPGAVGYSHPRPEQTQIVVNFRHRTDRGARVLGGGLLVNGDGRRETVDIVHVRLVHLTEEHSGIRAQALHIAALPLGIDRVEGEAGFPAAGEAGDNDQLVARDFDVDILEVVLSCALDKNAVVHTQSSTAMSAVFPRVSSISADGASSICQPIFPALTKTVSSPSILL